MAMIGIKMMVRVTVARAVGVGMFVFVKDDFEMAVEYVRYAAERPQVGHVRTAFQARDHRLGHSKALRELQLRLARFAAHL